MNTDYRYLLETPRVTGRRQQKFQCPHCGRPRCFVRYVDTHNDCQYVADDVGKCDHEHSCGYHYKPGEYHRDHQWVQSVATPSQQPPTRRTNFQSSTFHSQLIPLPSALVAASHSAGSIFWQWFATDLAQRLGLQPELLQRIYEDYRIGADARRNVIFWQIDHRQQVRTGHIMQYQGDGKRHQGYQNWVHSERTYSDSVPEGFVLRQCLFGEHLLALRPEAHVCLVESEKTALVMAAHQPRHLWLATCGCGGLNPEKLECLRGRRLTLFPDSGCLQKWQNVMQKTQGLRYTISDHLEQYPANTDLADLLLHPP